MKGLDSRFNFWKLILNAWFTTWTEIGKSMKFFCKNWVERLLTVNLTEISRREIRKKIFSPFMKKRKIQSNENISKERGCLVQSNEKISKERWCLVHSNENISKERWCLIQSNENISKERGCLVHRNENISKERGCLVQSNKKKSKERLG